MAGPPSSAFGLATLVFQGAGVPEGAVTSFGIGWPSTTESLGGIAAAFGQFHEDNFSVNVGLARVEFKQGPELTGPTHVVPVGVVGLVTGGSAPPNTSALIHKRIDDLTGRLHGRSYWPGLAESMVTDSGAISPASIPFIQAGLDDLYAAVALTTSGWYVFSDVSSDPRVVSSFEIDSRAATQRRRQRR